MGFCGLGFRGLGFRIWGFGFGVSGFKVLGFRVLGVLGGFGLRILVVCRIMSRFWRLARVVASGRLRAISEGGGLVFAS